MNNSRDDIDIDNLGYIGYSMGGRPGYRIVHNYTQFKCFIGVGTRLALTEDDDVLYANATRDLNVLMVVARFDEGSSTLENIKIGMGLRLQKDPDEIDVGKVYGSFKDNNASKIFLDDNSDHLLVGWDQDYIRQARDWVINTFPDVRAPDENFYVNNRLMILIFQLIGGIGLFFSIIEPISNKILKPKDEDFYKIELQTVQEDSLRNHMKKGIIYPIVFGILGMVIVLPFFIFLPLPIASIMITLLSGEAFGFLLVVRQYSKQENKGLIEILKAPFQKEQKILLKEISFGVILMILLYGILYFSIGLNYLNLGVSIFKVLWLPVMYVPIFILVILFSIMMQGILQQKFLKDSKGVIKTVGLSFGLNMSYLCFFIVGLSV
ncbi:MAG: hypothetical protein GY870_12140, partial [archaeon]|nr:hypothetical protein [archaeon]